MPPVEESGCNSQSFSQSIDLPPAQPMTPMSQSSQSSGKGSSTFFVLKGLLEQEKTPENFLTQTREDESSLPVLPLRVQLPVLAEQVRNYLYYHQWDEAITVLKEIISLRSPLDSFFEIKQLVDTLIKIGDFEEAFDWVKKLSPQQQDGLKIEIFRARAGQRFLVKNYHGAYSDINQRLDLIKSCFGFRFRAEVHLALGRFQRALEDCDRALTYERYNPLVFAVRAKANFHLGNYQASIDDCKKTTSDRFELLMVCGRAHMELGQFQDATNFFRMANRERPANYEGFRWRGEVEIRKKAFQEAFWEFDHALKLKPGDVPCLFGRGCASLELGNHDAAGIDFQRVLEIEPEHMSAKDKLVLARKSATEKELSGPDRKRLRCSPK